MPKTQSLLLILLLKGLTNVSENPFLLCKVLPFKNCFIVNLQDENYNKIIVGLDLIRQLKFGEIIEYTLEVGVFF